jgi:hypothetical protein
MDGQQSNMLKREGDEATKEWQEGCGLRPPKVQKDDCCCCTVAAAVAWHFSAVVSTPH